MLTFAIFPFVLFFLGAALVTGLPLAATLHTYYENRGRKAVKCPDTGQTADVEIDHSFALKSAMRGQEHSRVQSCSRWPQDGECGQECLVQIDASPENLERLFARSLAGSTCAMCTREITPSDWRQARLGVLNQKQQLLELRDMSVDNLQSTLQDSRPLCWTCHQEERVRQVIPLHVMRGGRVGLSSLHEPL
jgi:hypothetical protein